MVFWLGWLCGTGLVAAGGLVWLAVRHAVEKADGRRQTKTYSTQWEEIHNFLTYDGSNKEVKHGKRQ